MYQLKVMCSLLSKRR